MEKNILTEGIITRWLRIVGKTKHKKSCMRAEVFGVKRNPGWFKKIVTGEQREMSAFEYRQAGAKVRLYNDYYGHFS